MDNKRLESVVENVDVCGSLGVAYVYANEHEAEQMEQNHHKDGLLICCGGYFNAVWVRYPTNP